LALTRWIGRGTAWVVFAIAMILALLAGRLMLGPVQVDFLRPYIDRGLEGQIEGYAVEFDHAVLAWGGWSQPIDIRVTRVRLRDADGLAVIELPQVAVGFDAASVFSGSFTPRRIELFQPVFQLSRKRDGSFALRNDKGPAGSDELLRQLLDSMLAPPSSANELRRLTVREAVLAIDDLAGEENWRVPGAMLDIRRTDAGVEVRLSGVLEGEARRAGFSLTGSYARATEAAAFRLALDGAIPSMFARPEGALRVLRGWDLPVSGHARMNAARDGAVGRIDFDMTAAAGRLALPALAGPVPVEGAVLKGHLDRPAGRLALETMRLSVAGGEIAGAATLFTSLQGDGGALDATLARLPFRTLAALWPVSVKTGTRAWFDRNVAAGTITSGAATVRVELVAAGQPSAVRFGLEFEYEGLEAHYLRPVPPISDGRGRARLTPEEFELVLDRGRIADPATGIDIDVVALHGLIEGLDRPGQHTAVIDLALDLEVPELLAVLDYPPLGYARAFGVAPDAIGGHARARARFEIPLIKQVALKDIVYGATLIAEGFDLRRGFETLEPTPGEIALRLDPRGIVASGRLGFLGVPVDVDWTERFNVKDGLPTAYAVRARIPAADLRRLGLPDAVEIEGAVAATAELAGRGVQIARGTVEADLSGAAVGLPLLAWRKAPGEPGMLSADVATGDGGLRPGRFRVSMPALEIAGSLSFDDAGAFAAADLAPFRVGDTDATVAMRQPAERPVEIAISGRQIDLRPFLEDDEGQSEAGEEKPESDFAAAVTVDVDQALAPEAVPIRDMNAALRIARGELDDGKIEGVLRSGRSMSIDYRLSGDNPGIDVRSDDAGELLRTLGVLNGVTGGELTVTGRISGPRGKRHTVGTLQARNFRIKDSPMMAQMLTLGSLSGLRDLLTGEGIGFDRFDVDFDLGEGTLLLRDGRGLGSQLGVRMRGRIYDGQEKLDIDGTLAPAYALNTVLDYVPVLGTMLSGGENEGLIAIRFSVRGTVDKPDVSVNPLSALTPGFLRGIFDVFSQPPSNAKPEPGGKGGTR
jgi:hypothetical protein